MPKEKSPGLKILWLWTIGTAAVLVTSVIRTRLRDLENAMNAQQQQQENQGASLGSSMVDTFPSSEGSEVDGKP